MLQSLFRDSVLYTLSTILTRGISFILLPVYTRALSAEEFGLLDYFVALGAISSILITLEILQGLARYVPEYLDNTQLKRAYASTSMWFVLGSYSMMLVFACSFSSHIAIFLLDEPKRADLIIFAASSYWVAGVLNLVHGQLRWELRAATSALLALMAAFLTVCASVVLVIWMQWGIRGALLAQIIGGLLALIPSLYLTRASFGLNFDGPSFRQMLNYSLPLIPSSLAVICAQYFDRIVLKELVGLSELGIYAVGQKISLMVTLILVGFRTALTPLIYANHTRASTPENLAKVFQLFCFAALSITLIISVFARDIVRLFSAPAYAEAANVVPFLIFSVLLANMYIFAPGLDIQRKTAVISLINIGVAGINVILNYIFIPGFGVVGAALSALLAFGIGFFVYLFASQRLYPVPHAWKIIVKTLIIQLGGLATFYAASDIFQEVFLLRVLLIVLTVALMVYIQGVGLSFVLQSMTGLGRALLERVR